MSDKWFFSAWYMHPDGSKIPHDQGGFVMTHAEWEAAKAAIDAAYRQVSEAEIAKANHQKWLRSPLAPPDERVCDVKPTVNTSLRRGRPGFVYLLKAEETGLYKIGQSRKPKARVAQITRTSPFALTVMCVIETDNMDGTERHWHERFADRRDKGEWFRLSMADVADFFAEGRAP